MFFRLRDKGFNAYLRFFNGSVWVHNWGLLKPRRAFSGALPPDPQYLFSFHEKRKKYQKRNSPAAWILLKTGLSFLKCPNSGLRPSNSVHFLTERGFCFLHAKFMRPGLCEGEATLLRSSPDASSWCTLGIPSNERSDVATIQRIPASWISG